MQKQLKENTVHHWAGRFMDTLAQPAKPPRQLLYTPAPLNRWRKDWPPSTGWQLSDYYCWITMVRAGSLRGALY